MFNKHIALLVSTILLLATNTLEAQAKKDKMDATDSRFKQTFSEAFDLNRVRYTLKDSKLFAFVND